MYTTIITLHKQQISQRQIAKLTNSNRRTISKIIRRYTEQQIETPVPYPRSSSLEEWHEQIVELLSSNLSVVRIFEKLCDAGFGGSYSSLSRYVRRHNIKKNTCIRLHTDSGEEAQVDFGDIGRRYDETGKLRKAYVFNMRLSYSRLDYYEIVFDQKVDTWVNCHLRAFKFFGGVPQVIKLDNLKSGVLDANFYEPIYQKEYKRLAEHYGCWLSPCRPYQPQEKGKVESGIKYVKNNFFAGRDFRNNAEMNQQLIQWLSAANDRTHGTTKSIPREVFEQEEKASLIKLPLTTFDMSSWHSRKVAKDCHITVQNNYYSVPAKYVAEVVTISLSSQIVKIYAANDEIIATHARAAGYGIFTTNTSHYAKGKKYCPGFAEHDEKHQENMIKMGTNCAKMLVYIQQEHKRDWYRAVRGIVKLRDFYSDELIDKACLRALHFGISSYQKIKTILESNSYELPLANSNSGGDHASIN